MTELKLYEIPSAMEQILNEVDEDGVLTENALANLDKIELSLQEKSTGIWMIMTKLEWFENTIDAEIKRLQDLKKSYKANRENLKQYLWYNLQKLWKEKLETELFKFSFRKSESVKITDETIIPDEFFKEKTVKTLDKARVKQVLKEWNFMSGAELEIKNNLQIK